MSFKLAAIVGAFVLIAVVVVAVMVSDDDDNGGGSTVGQAVPSKESFCSVMAQTNGTRLVKLVQTGELGSRASWSWIVESVTDMATPAIRSDMTELREGIRSDPANPNPETLAAAARVDAYVTQTCSSSRWARHENSSR